MSGDQLFQHVTQALFVLIFLAVAVQAARQPLRAKIDTALLFGAATLTIAAGWVMAALAITPSPALSALTGSLVMALPYLLLRLVEDFSEVPPWVMRAAETGLALSAISLFVFPAPLPVPLLLLLVLYFLVLEVYAAIAFVREARRASGVTSRRMQAVAAGSLFLGVAFLMAGLQAGLPAFAGVWTVLSRVFALTSGVSYFLGFAPPALLRRAWQEPELRAFLGRAASLPRLPDTAAIVRELEAGAAKSVGAPRAVIGLWDEAAGVLRFSVRSADGAGTKHVELVPGQRIVGQVFASQRPLFSTNVARDDPANAAIYRQRGVVAMLASPITAGEMRLGVLTVYAPRAPIFAEDDLVLVQLLADQAAVVLESRALIDEAAAVRAREEATRLKEDFLSAAAHDLKTPLTSLLVQVQLLDRRARRDPQAPADLAGIERLAKQSQRLNELVLELLDATRLEHGELLGARETVDFVEIARDLCQQYASDRHRCVLEADEPVLGHEYDRSRVTQLLENLLDNAIKYSPSGGEVRVKVWHESCVALITVSDCGIGIPATDMPHIFDRFYRGANVDDRRFAGMGLGLFICRRIAELHGGCIWATSKPGQGTTFHAKLPLTAHSSDSRASAPADRGTLGGTSSLLAGGVQHVHHE